MLFTISLSHIDLLNTGYTLLTILLIKDTDI